MDGLYNIVGQLYTIPDLVRGVTDSPSRGNNRFPKSEVPDLSGSAIAVAAACA